MSAVYLDFEFNKSSEQYLNLVCCSTDVEFKDGTIESKDWWLHNQPFAYQMLRHYLEKHKEKIFVAYSVEAEASSMYSLGLNVLEFKFFDLYIEYRMLQNHNNELLYGEQLIDGKVKKLRIGGEKGKSNFAAACYKLLKIIVDTDHKDAMRDLIISAPDEFTPEEQKQIMEYCRSDVKPLRDLRKAIASYYRRVIPKAHWGTIKDEALLRGEFSARIALQVRHGYPVNVEWLYNFSEQAQLVLDDAAKDINSQFPKNMQPFRWNKKDRRYSANTSVWKKWIEDNHDTWEVTDSNNISLKLEAWTKHYNYGHDYPRGHFGAQIIRYLKLKQAMNGFNPNSKKNIFNFLGSDGRIRPFMNHFGAQSGRTQPASSSFIFLKPAWQRAMVRPKKGKSIGDLDYSSQEFLLSALLSGDKKMLEAYRSGDVYLAFGKMIGWIPQDGTKSSHKFERNVCKAVVLGLSYLMSKYGLAKKLTEDTGRIYTEDEAQELIDQFDETFDVFAEWRKELIEEYEIEGYIRMQDGWYMFGDNENFRSVGNVRTQGLGAIIMRKAIALAQDRGLTVIFSLHDALYIEYDEGDYGALDTLKECMEEAFCYYFEGEMKEYAKMIRVDPNTWGDEFKEAELYQKEDGTFGIKTDYITTPKGLKSPCSQYFIDERAVNEWGKFNKYMINSLGTEMLG